MLVRVTIENKVIKLVISKMEHILYHGIMTHGAFSKTFIEPSEKLLRILLRVDYT